jgi:hypothetical protein
MAIALAATLCLAAQPTATITRRPVILYKAPVEQHYLYYSRGEQIDKIPAGEQIEVTQTVSVDTAFGRQTWYEVRRHTGKARKGWVEAAELGQKPGK